MCGIAGKIYFNPEKKVSPELVNAMCDQIVHRGPDDRGVYTHKNVGLGHQRLSIIDLSKAGHNPMPNEDETVWIVFNGEIYNFQELRPELEKKGHTFRSNCDTEVIIHLYEEYGEDCLKYLRGMFAFAIWDDAKKRLFLARDRMGQKPLKYYVGKDFIAFASELKAILVDPEIPREVDLRAVNEFLTYSYVPAPRTGLRGIKKLPQAHCMTIDLKYPEKIEPKRYWDIDYSQKQALSADEWGEILEEKAKEATRLRMISDVPLGAFLSGGVDSSAIVAFMSEYSNQPVKTFSIGFSVDKYNELPYAQVVADQYQTDHTVFQVEAQQIDLIPKLAWHYEEPYSDSSGLPTYIVSKLAREHVTVVLNGDAGDENFAGYDWYKVHKLNILYRKLFPKPIRQVLEKTGLLFAPHFRRMFFVRLHALLYSMKFDLGTQYPFYCSSFYPFQKEAIFTKEFFKEAGGADEAIHIIAEKYHSARAAEEMDRASYTDMNAFLVDDLMTKMDIASMANSLEARSPLLDHHFVETAAQVPFNLKLKGKEGKYVFKKMLEKYLPKKEVLYRRKRGFSIPVEDWFRKDLTSYMKDILLDQRTLSRGLYKREALEKMLNDHIETPVGHGRRIWALICLELWYRQFIDDFKPMA